jgi:hypothetical protein
MVENKKHFVLLLLGIFCKKFTTTGYVFHTAIGKPMPITEFKFMLLGSIFSMGCVVVSYPKTVNTCAIFFAAR